MNEQDLGAIYKVLIVFSLPVTLGLILYGLDALLARLDRDWQERLRKMLDW